MSHTLYTGISELVLPDARQTNTTPLHVLRNAFMWVSQGRIQATGPVGEIPTGAPRERIDLGGRAVIPGLVDSHTHVVYANHRIDEMGRRARGETYEEIARAGGGIQSSVRALRDTSEDDLVRQSLPRLRSMLNRGTTTCEIKSGYGLTPDLEIKHLSAIAAVARQTTQDIRATALAHIVPPEARSNPDSYIETFCREVIAVAAQEKLARHVDVFVEEGAFTPAQARTFAAAAQSHQLPLKLHVDQLRPGGGAQLAAELQALSADHLEYTDAAGAAAMAQAGVVATVLPGCALFLGKGPWPNARALRDAGCEVAVATDCNPGSAMVVDLLLCATVAATRCGLTLEEALWGVTRGGAKALGLRDRGCLSVGERADFVVLDHDDWRAALYHVASAPLHAVATFGTLKSVKAAA